MNATDMSLGAQFSFVQTQFDRLCSDLDGFPVARGVIASMAFSVAFTPIALLNYPKEICGYRRPLWVEEALQAELEEDPLRYDHARNWVAYENAEARPYIHLLDGGLSDNIGVRAVATAVISSDSEWGLTEMLAGGTVKRLAVIIVDAKTTNRMDKDRKPRPPGIPSVLVASSGNPMANYSSETVDRLNTFFRFMTEVSRRFEEGRAACDDMAADCCQGSDSPEECRTERSRRCYRDFQLTDRDRPTSPRLYLVHVRFEAAEDEAILQWLNALPTRLQLPREDVELLISKAPALLERSADFRRLLDDLGGEEQ